MYNTVHVHVYVHVHTLYIHNLKVYRRVNKVTHIPMGSTPWNEEAPPWDLWRETVKLRHTMYNVHVHLLRITCMCTLYSTLAKA